MGSIALPPPSEVPPILERLRRAINAHDLEAVVACFAEDYSNETPVHPSRSFVGADQVRRNWTQILGGVHDLRAELVRWAVAEEVWAEWDWTGTRPDRTPFAMRGVTIFGTGEDGAAAWSRFYMEPVDPSGGDVSIAVRDASGAGA